MSIQEIAQTWNCILILLSEFLGNTNFVFRNKKNKSLLNLYASVNGLIWLFSVGGELGSMTISFCLNLLVESKWKMKIYFLDALEVAKKFVCWCKPNLMKHCGSRLLLLACFLCEGQVIQLHCLAFSEVVHLFTNPCKLAEIHETSHNYVELLAIRCIHTTSAENTLFQGGYASILPFLRGVHVNFTFHVHFTFFREVKVICSLI